MTATRLEGLSEKIFLDRYAWKKADPREAKPGDTVLVLTKDDPAFPAKEVGEVVARSGSRATVRTRSGELVETEADRLTLAEEREPGQMWDRLARAMAAAEPDEESRRLWEERFRSLLDDWKLVPGGRIAAGAGTSEELTLFNCYVLPSPRDSRGGIMQTLGEMTEIMSRGGGVGINLSSLRPRRAPVAGVNGSSSGSVSWGGLFSYTTGLIEQGGSRRGALMLMLNDWHPDLLDFIAVKQTKGELTNANLSVCVSDRFMQAVREDDDWELAFPDMKHPLYDEHWTGDLAAWRELGGAVTAWRTVKAREAWAAIVESAWKSAEPGVVFMERYNEMSNSWYFNPLIATNPCGEQALPPWGVCNLSSINLSRFHDESRQDVDWEELARVVRGSVRFLDNVIDTTPYHFAANERNQQRERRIGLGTMGLAELLIRLGIRYGSPESLAFLDRLYSFIAREAYLASAELAAEKGPFPAFEAEPYLKSGFMRSLAERFPEVAEAVRRSGMRNVTVLTQAPTGSTGTMVGTSTGIEPYFAFEYVRQSRLGLDRQLVPIARQWKEAHPGEELPEPFVTAMDLSAEDHIRVQAAIQRWVDSSISKTANCPADFTVEDTRRLYELAYELGCKGVTIYRDGSRDTQVLSAAGGKKGEEGQGAARAAEGGGAEGDGVAAGADAGQAGGGAGAAGEGAVSGADAGEGAARGFAGSAAAGADAGQGAASGFAGSGAAGADAGQGAARGFAGSGAAEADAGQGAARGDAAEPPVLSSPVSSALVPSTSVPSTSAPSTSVPSGRIVDHEYKRRPAVLRGSTYRMNTPLGMAYITINDLDGTPGEIFLNVGKAGSDVFAMAEALGRVCSLFLRYGEHGRKVGLLIKHLKGIGGSGATGFGASRVESIADAVAKALEQHAASGGEAAAPDAGAGERGSRAKDAPLGSEMHAGFRAPADSGADAGSRAHAGSDTHVGSRAHASSDTHAGSRAHAEERAVAADLCPSCGSAALLRLEGCSTCGSCGYSRC